MSDNLLQYIADTQREQNEALAALRADVARVEAGLQPFAEIRDRISHVSTRVTSLEHDRTRAKTALMLLYTGGGMIVSAVVWLFSR